MSPFPGSLSVSNSYIPDNIPALHFTLNMANSRLRLENFRQWNPFQDEAQPLRDPSNICRYPSPVSIAATPPPSKAGQHPLPARPPVEVCMDGGLRSASQAPDLEPAESEPVDQRSLTSNSDDPTQPQEVCSGENIDPAILYDEGHTGTEQIRESESVAGVGLDQDLALAQGDSLSDSRPSEVHSPSRPRQRVQGEATGSNGQRIQAPKRSSPGRKHTGKVSSRLPTTGTGRRKHPPFSPPFVLSSWSCQLKIGTVVSVLAVRGGFITLCFCFPKHKCSVCLRLQSQR